MKPQLPNVTRPGSNHTGIALHPDFAADMLQGTEEFGPTTRGGADQLAENRIRVAQISQPAGTMPPTLDVPIENLPLLDKLGARLQFERTGVRLYQALISKLDAYGTFPGGPSRADLEQIRDEEHRHLLLVQDIIEELEGDPTVVTPCANLQAVASRGLCDVLVDPRTNLIECLEAIMVAELADHESWELLATTAELMGKSDLGPRLREGERTEAEHLVKVRNWLVVASQLATKAVD
ncbi:MAG: ferritin-like domain-containing protein [Deltaproteobacteria bacterium]|nr:ferritin-like domain-containing protein [Deltaproteobacteria bacterium]